MRDQGTLYHLRNVINRRNVVDKPMNAVEACEDFFLLVVESHVLAAAMALFGMVATDNTPSNKQFFPAGSEKLPPAERKQVLLMACGAIVDTHVDLQFVGKHTRQGPKAAEVDRVQQYASEVLTHGLLLMEFIDAIREGDGDRIIRCWTRD